MRKETTNPVRGERREETKRLREAMCSERQLKDASMQFDQAAIDKSRQIPVDEKGTWDVKGKGRARMSRQSTDIGEQTVHSDSGCRTSNQHNNRPSRGYLQI